MKGWTLLLLLALSVGCREARAPTPREPLGAGELCATHPGEAIAPMDAVACDYVRLALALGERDPDSLDFAIASPESGTAAHKEYLSLEQIALRAHQLRDRLRSLPTLGEETRGRASVLDLQLASIETRVGMLRGRTLPFDSEAKSLLNTTVMPDTEANARTRVRAEVASLLPHSRGAGLAAGLSLADRYAAYDRRFLVPADRLTQVMQAALAACRASTAKFLPLPAGEAVDLTFARNQPWSAFSRYRGGGHSTIALNVDLPITVDEALELACHEGYPGHHVFNTLRELALVRDRHLPEAEVQLTFSPQSYVSEAAAAFAPRLAFASEERMRVERDVLFSLAGLPVSEAERYVRISSLVRELDSAEPAIAREYLDGHLEFVRAEEALATGALMAHAEASLLYMNEYRSYMLAYTDGRRRVAALADAAVSGACRQGVVCTKAETASRWAAYGKLARGFDVSLSAKGSAL